MKKKLIVPALFLLIILVFSGCKPEQRPANNDSPFRRPSGNLPVELVFYADEGGTFELPLNGASGYAAINIPVFQSANLFSNFIGTLDAGQGFTILREEGDWWNIEIAGNIAGNNNGWVMHKYCFINLPDIIPSIVYNITNAYYSLFRSSGEDIPNITGRALYHAWDFNERLGREEFIAPVLYAMAPKVFAAQQAALAEGNTLIMYEAFRPSSAHNELHEHFSLMVNTYPHIRAGITADNFNIRWFLAEAPYNHQRGTAIDTSLGKINNWEVRTTGPYKYMFITEYAEFPMQTDIHELSVAAAVFDSTVHARSTTSWIGAEVSSLATEGTHLMLRYCTGAGLIPLASEWWHYNDLVNTAVAIDLDITGEFIIQSSYSREPIRN